MTELHGWDHDRAAARIGELVRARLAGDRPLGRTPSSRDVAALAAVGADGLGVDAALDLVESVLLPNNVSLDHPHFLAYVPAAPATSAVLLDALVGAWSFSAESWQEAGGAVAAENVALEWLCSLVGWPAGAGGCFVSGGSAANLSALAVARDHGRAATPPPARGRVACAASAHSSVRGAASLLGLEVVTVPGDERDRLTADALDRTLGGVAGVCAVVASAGATNTGAIDDLDGVARWCREHACWFHVDAAYGGAALCVPELRERFAGIEHADSVVVDPHKWLFGPLDCAAVLYADPTLARATHRQLAPYIDAFGEEHWNPSDYAFHLTRRARGLPLWFTLTAHGTDAMSRAVRRGVELATATARRVDAIGPPVRLVMEPELSVVLLERDGWARAEWDEWAAAALRDGIAFVAPTRWRGCDVGRVVFLHPDASLDVVDELLGRLSAAPR